MSVPRLSVREYGFPLGAVFDAALDAVVIMDLSGTVQDWNPSAELIFGHRRADAVGRELAELIIPGALREAHRQALARYLQTGQHTILNRRIELPALGREGEEFRIELTVTEVSDGEQKLFIGFMRDLGRLDEGRRENARLQERMAFLAQAGLVLESSLDIEETLHRLAQLTVPELAELTVIDLLGDGRAIGTAVAAATDPQVARQLEETRRHEPLQLNSAHPVAEVLATGTPRLIETMSPHFHASLAQGPEHRETIRRLGYRSAIVVPLVARQHVLGALSLLRMEHPEPYTQEDLVLAIELARRAALAVDNARLFGAMRTLATTLQDSLLPRAMPQIPGVRLAARYRAAAEGQEVGGDFYDAFALDEHRWGIAIGDVVGKGPEAAALTAMARHTVRALAGPDPSRVLAALNDALVGHPDVGPGRFLTLLFAVAEREGAGLRLHIAAGGHPPAIVRRADGRVSLIPTAGTLLGIAPEVSYRAQTDHLGAGDTLILYTDGLTDARAPAVMLSDEDLASLVAKAQGLSGSALAAYLEAAATAGAAPRDDIALLVLDVEAQEPAGGRGSLSG